MKLYLAPMADLTHAPFRELVRRYCPETICMTEMINIRYIKSTNPEDDPYLTPYNGEDSLIAQVIGKEEEDFRTVIPKIEKLSHISGINLNLGCTKGRFQKYGWGAALLTYPEKIENILKVIKGSTKLPVSVKMRVPQNTDNFIRLLNIFDSLSINFVAVHPRHPEDGFRKKARWELIGLAVRESSIPIVGNGDIFSPEDAERMIESTGASGVMVGRAALIRPWIFRDIKDHIDGRHIQDPPEPTEPVILMAEGIKRYLPENWWSKRMDSFLYWYLQNFSHALFYLRKTRKAKDIDHKTEIACKLIEKEHFRSYPVSPFLSLC